MRMIIPYLKYETWENNLYLAVSLIYEQHENDRLICSEKLPMKGVLVPHEYISDDGGKTHIQKMWLRESPRALFGEFEYHNQFAGSVAPGTVVSFAI